MMKLLVYYPYGTAIADGVGRSILDIRLFKELRHLLNKAAGIEFPDNKVTYAVQGDLGVTYFTFWDSNLYIGNRVRILREGKARSFGPQGVPLYP
jgi:hypothetical protein